MKTTRRILIALALAGFLAAPLMDAFGDTQIRVDARVQIQPQPRDLQVWIWPDRGEGSYYFPGENIYLNVEVTRDCFLILYDIDTRGQLRVLFPYDPWDDNFVRAGDVVSFPRPRDGYEWTVEGPSGTEYIQAIATEFPMPLPDWPVYLRSVNHGGAVHHDKALRDFRCDDDRLDYIRVVNRKITGRYWDWCATDLASFQVRPRHWSPRPHVYDPWPEIFYGEIYIGWPIGGRIYVDDIYIGIAPLWVPRHSHGFHRITCYEGNRIVRAQNVHFYPKRDFRFDEPRYKTRDVFANGHVRQARRDGADHFEFNTRDYQKKDPAQRQEMRRDQTLRKERVQDRSPQRAAPDRKKVSPSPQRGDDTRATVMTPRIEPAPDNRADRNRSESIPDRARVQDKQETDAKEQKSGWLKSALSGAVKVAGEARSVKKRSTGDKSGPAEVASSKTPGDKKKEMKQTEKPEMVQKAQVSKSGPTTTGKKKR